MMSEQAVLNRAISNSIHGSGEALIPQPGKNTLSQQLSISGLNGNSSHIAAATLNGTMNTLRTPPENAASIPEHFYHSTPEGRIIPLGDSGIASINPLTGIIPPLGRTQDSLMYFGPTPSTFTNSSTSLGLNPCTIIAALLDSVIAALDNADDATAWLLHDLLISWELICPGLVEGRLRKIQIGDILATELFQFPHTKSIKWILTILGAGMPCARATKYLEELLATTTNPLSETFLAGPRATKFREAVAMLEEGHCFADVVFSADLMKRTLNGTANIGDARKALALAKDADKKRRGFR